MFGWFSQGHRVQRRTACSCSGSSQKRGHAGWPHLPRRETGPEGGRRQPGAQSFCLFSEPPRKAAVPLVNSLCLGAGLLAHCLENSLSRLPSKGKTSTEPPLGRVGSATLCESAPALGSGPAAPSGFPERCPAGLLPAVLARSSSLRAVLEPRLPPKPTGHAAPSPSTGERGPACITLGFCPRCPGRQQADDPAQCACESWPSSLSAGYLPFLGFTCLCVKGSFTNDHTQSGVCRFTQRHS